MDAEVFLNEMTKNSQYLLVKISDLIRSESEAHPIENFDLCLHVTLSKLFLISIANLSYEDGMSKNTFLEKVYKMIDRSGQAFKADPRDLDDIFTDFDVVFNIKKH